MYIYKSHDFTEQERRKKWVHYKEHQAKIGLPSRQKNTASEIWKSLGKYTQNSQKSKKDVEKFIKL